MIDQRELEEAGLFEGAERYFRKVEKAESKGAASVTRPHRELLRRYTGEIAEAVREVCEAKRPGVRWAGEPVCRALGYETVGFLALKVMLDGLTSPTSGRRETLQSCGRQLATLMITELRFRRFRAMAPQLFQWKVENFSGSTQVHRNRSLNAGLRSAMYCPDHPAAPCECEHRLPIDTSDIEAMLPSQRERAGVGSVLVKLAAEVTGLVELRKRFDYRGQRHANVYLFPAAELTEWIEKRHAVLANLYPLFLPMVETPVPWGSRQTGGYRYALRGQVQMVRAPRSVVRDRGELSPELYVGLNHLQGTAWRVDAWMLQQVEDVRASRAASEKLGIPSVEKCLPPPRPEDIDTNAEARKVWRREAAQAHDAEAVRLSMVHNLDKTLSVAHRLAGEDRIYFPHNLDFRGRIYPIPLYLHPQGDDLTRGLLRFAKAEPMGKHGLYALKLHVAGTLGEVPGGGLKLSKLPMQKRLEWVDANLGMLTEIPADPIATLDYWSEADKPWQFLAACRELRLAYRSAEPERFASSLALQMDGSCNGIQHFSAMLRDEAGARSVNLTKATALDEPNDLYSDVSEAVWARLMADDNPLAEKWIAAHHAGTIAIDRKLCKRPAMTFGYGSAVPGFTQQLEDDFNLREIFGRDTRKMARYMAEVIYASLGSTIHGARTGMEYLTALGRAFVQETGSELTWTTPLGFRVHQLYHQQNTQVVVSTITSGSIRLRVDLNVNESTDEINPREQVQGFAPNFVHSLDATALLYTSANVGPEVPFGAIHDAYLTTAAHYWKLAEVTREQFVRLYAEHNVLEDLWVELAGLVLANGGDPEVLPEPPAMGGFDLDEVSEATYFFS